MSKREIKVNRLGSLHDWKEDLDYDSISETLGLLDIYWSAVSDKVEKKVFPKQSLKEINEWLEKNQQYIPLFEKRGRKLHEDYMYTMEIMSQPVPKSRYNH